MARRERENGEFLAMLQRMLKAYGERVANADDWDLNEMLVLRESVEQAIAAAVLGQRRNFDRSWADIALGLGTSRQAAFKRYGAADQRQNLAALAEVGGDA
jgi:hypothetical protein